MYVTKSQKRWEAVTPHHHPGEIDQLKNLFSYLRLVHLGASGVSKLLFLIVSLFWDIFFFLLYIHDKKQSIKTRKKEKEYVCFCIYYFD